MQVYRGLDRLDIRKEAWITVGIFDGVHLGHRKIIDGLAAEASRGGGVGLLVTFDPHPQEVLRRTAKPVPLLTRLDEKLELLEVTGLDGTVVLPFTPELAAADGTAFVAEWLMPRLHLAEWVVGYNHAFGKGRRGDASLLARLGQEFGFRVRVEPPFSMDGEPVSSTRIRNMILNGNVVEANRLLGRTYAVRGQVVQGKGLGRDLGFPTANLDLGDAGKCIPGDGVYAAFVAFDGKPRPAVANVGRCPTVGGCNRSIEAHVFDFHGNLYGATLRLHFVEKLREELRFESVSAMIGQMVRDADLARERLTRQGG
jgi:riboflavin kinase/FMN adenylyltransferase